LLNRFQQRLHTAVDYSVSGGLIREIDRRLGAVENTLKHAGELNREIRQSLEALSNHSAVQSSFNHDLGLRFERLQLGVDAIRLEHQSLEVEIRPLLSSVSEQLNAGSSFQGQSGTFSLIQKTLQQTDLLLQRVAIPIGDDVLVRSPYGFLLTPTEDERLLAALLATAGCLEPGTVTIICALLEEGDWAVDVGAHIGTTVFPAARRVGPSGRVIAVEPASRVGALFKRSIQINSLDDQIKFHPVAAGESLGRADLHQGKFTGHASLFELPEADRTEPVEVWPLDALIEPRQAVKLVKIDAEGSELNVRRGMNRIIADNPALAIIVEFGPSHLDRSNTSIETWLAEMLAPDFVAYEINEKDGSLRKLRPVEDLSSVFSVNLLLLRQPPSDFPLLHFI